MAALAKEKARQARLMGSDKEPTRALTPNVLRCVDDLLLNAVQLTGTLKMGLNRFWNAQVNTGTLKMAIFGRELAMIVFGRQHFIEDAQSEKAL